MEDRAAQHAVDLACRSCRAAGSARRTTPTSTTPSARGRTRSRRPGCPASWSARSWVRRVGRSNARVARRRRRSQPFCTRERRGLCGLGRRGTGERAQALALGRRRLDLPGERRQRPCGASGDERRPRRRARARPPRTGSARAASPRRRRPGERARAAAAAGCTRSRRGTGHGSRDRAARAAHRGDLLEAAARVLVEERLDAGTARRSVPCSSPRTNTVSKRRVRARSRSMTATRPGAPARSPRTEARSSAASTSRRPSVPPCARRGSRARRARGPTASWACEVGPRPRAERRGDDAVGVPKHGRAHRRDRLDGCVRSASARSSRRSDRPRGARR